MCMILSECVFYPDAHPIRMCILSECGMYSGTRVFRVTVTFGSPATLAQRGMLAS